MTDIAALKNELQAQLKDGFQDYFRLLATFLSAKLSKREFDNYIKHQLKDKVALHNAFVLAILGQAFANTPPPDALSVRAPKPKEKRRPKKLKISGSLPIKSHLRETSGIRNPKKMWAVRERGVAVVGDGGAALLPEMREMAERMRAIAEEEGLERVEDDAVALMQAGLHAHLLRLIRSAVPVQETTAFVMPGLSRKREREEASAAPGDVLLTRGSLRVAVSKNGKGLLRDDMPLQRERLLLLE